MLCIQRIPGIKAACKLIDSGETFDAIFAACDLIAIGAMRAIKDRGLRIPEDIAVVGFDDIVTAMYATPPLTTVKQDTQLAGELLVCALLESIKGINVQATLIRPKLVVRKSCGSGTPIP